MENNIIEVKNVTKVLGGRTVLSGINFQVQEGSIFGFLGPNGSGKTTTLRILLGLIIPDTGEVTIMGQNPITMTREIKKGFGVVLEDHGLNERLTALQNLDFFGQIYGLASDVRKSRIQELLDKMDLSSYEKKPVGTFSKGMKQRLALARALIHDPKVLFLDEPTSNLDPEGTVFIRNMIFGLAKDEGRTVFINSHDLDEVERICTEIAILKQGSIMLQGAIYDLRRSTDQTIIEIKLEDSKTLTELSKLLDSLSYVKCHKIEKDVVIVELMDESSRSTLFNVLAQNNIPILEFIQKKNGLEEIYMSIVTEEE